MPLANGVLALALSVTTVGGMAADSPPPPSLSVAVAGDFAAGANAQAVLSSMAASSPDLALALGDLSYGVTGQEQAWCDLVTSRFGPGFPFEVLAGNHESNGQNGMINDFSACLPNQLPGAVGTYGRQYYVDVPKANPLVRFVMISPGLPFPDGTWSYAAGTPRYDWTAAAIDGARAKSIPWVIVGQHYPCLSIGQYGCDGGPDLMNLLVAKKVDLVLNGHDHSYQRSKQLAHSAACPSIPLNTYVPGCVADADDTLVAGAGTVRVGVGTGGISPLHDVNAADPEADYVLARSGANLNPTWGHLALQITSDRISASFVRAAGGTFADAFTITRSPVLPNQPPVASATSSCTGLSCVFDGSASSDPDGSIASYAWAFGDGSTGAGATATHAYAAAGSYVATLTVTDNAGATATTTRTVTVTAPTNQPPVASATSSCTGLSCVFDGSASSDPDGSIASYAWAFGDGSTGAGATATHAYAAAGSYVATLTVTDNAGATATTTRTVTVTAPPVTYLVEDRFSRLLTGGWGSATTGGVWTSTAPARLSVDGTKGVQSHPAGSGQTTMLNQTALPAADLRVNLSVDKLPTGSGLYPSVVTRQTASGSYRVKLQLTGSQVRVFLIRATATGAETILASSGTVAGLPLAPGVPLTVRAVVTGTGPTMLQAKVWAAGQPEPPTWLLTASDSTAGLQVSGTVGLSTYLSSAATNAPIALGVDELTVTAP